MHKQRLWTRDFLCICFSNLFIFITYYTLIATLPLFVMEELKGSERQTGLVIAALVIAAVLIRPFAGKWVDELGKKKVLLASAALFLASSVMYLGVKSIFLLLALRFLHGVGFGVLTTSMGAIAADIVPDHRKGEGIGYFAAFMNLAMVIGPFLGLMIAAHYNFAVLFMILSIFSLFAFLCGSIIRIPGSLSMQKVNRDKPSGWRNMFETNAIPISLTGLLCAFAYSGIIAFVPVYAKDLGISQVGSYFFVIYALMIMLSRPFTGKIFDRLGPHIVIYPCIILYGIGLIILSQVHSPILFLITAAIIGVGYGTLFPSFQTIAVQSSPAHRRGAATGTYFLFYDLGFGFGAFILGSIALSMNYQAMYIISSIVVAFAVVPYYWLCHRKTSKKVDREAQLHL